MVHSSSDAYTPPTRVYGVDFSGAKKAGNHIWIAQGNAYRDNLYIDECSSAAEFFHVKADRDWSLPGLGRFMARESGAVFGLDFPFSLPAVLVTEDGWEEFIRAFPSHYHNADHFWRECQLVISAKFPGRKELRRRTDKEVNTPWSPCNWQIRFQTFHGIRDLLLPLIEKNAIVVPPFQAMSPCKTVVLEICPSASLQRLGLPYQHYKKGKTSGTPQQKENRRLILNGLEEKHGVVISNQSLKTKILEDLGGDALDSVIAAHTVWMAIQEPENLYPDLNRDQMLEGCVYVP